MSSGRFAARSAGGDSRLQDELIARLRALPVGPAPSAVFRSELRAQLVSITARVVAESGQGTAAAATGALARPARAAARSGRDVAGGVLRGLRRPLLGIASAAAVLALLIGGAVWISKGALPGDSLYGVKRASENVQLATAGNDVAKGYTYLDFASRRVGEASKLVGRPSAMALSGQRTVAGGAISDRTVSLVSSTLTSADSDSRSGMALLGNAAVAQMSADPLAKLQPWTVGQRAGLLEVESRVTSSPALVKRVQASLALLQRVSQRGAQLKAEIGCPCLSQANGDDLGPLPCSPCRSLAGSIPGATSAATGVPSAGATGRSAGSGPGPAGSAGGSLGGTGGGAGGSSGTGGGAVGGGGTGGTGVPSLPGGGPVLAPSGAPAPSLPPIPGISSTPPVSVGPSGITVGGPGVSASIGTGGASVAPPVGPTITLPGLPTVP